MKEIKLFVQCSALFLFFLFPTIDASSSQEEGDFAGDEICMECHEELYNKFWKNIHGVKGDPRTPAARDQQFVCESCHGPGAAHSETDGAEPVLALKAKSPESPQKKTAACLKCHTKGKVVMWHGGEHETRGLSCADCHSIHQENPKNLAKPSQTEVCIGCHQDMRPQLLRLSRHPIREGKIKCADCHNAHGTIADHLIDAQYVNLKCFECHAGVRGPYLWEHPSAVEDCLSCHRPHGSTHSALLNAKPPYLCQRCHSNVSHAGELQALSTAEAGQSVYRALNNRGFYRGCLNCHRSIHGSNHPSGKNLLR